MPSLFDQTHLGTMRLKNRFFRSATRDGLADDHGRSTPELVERYVELAKGGVGAIITGHAYVTEVEESKQPRQMGMYHDSLVEGYRALTDAVHRHDANIVLQISCVGAQTYSGGEGRLIWGPSPVQDLATGIAPKEMTTKELVFLQDAFAKAALRAKKAGFDGVQIHAAHGYLISKFLNPYYNRRADEYGGCIEQRARMLLETYAAIRRSVGVDFPILVKINCNDFMDGGMTFAECRYLCRTLAASGVTAIEISGGSFSSRPNEGPIRAVKSGAPPYFRDYASLIAQEVDVPVLLVGGNRDPRLMAELLDQTSIRYFSLCRPLICEPDLIGRWQNGDLRPLRCLSCNKCLGQQRTSCILDRGEG